MLVWNTKGTLWRQKLVQKVQRLLSLLAGWLASCAVQSAVCKLCSDSSLQLSGLPSSAPCSSRLLAAMFSHWRRSLRHDQKGTVRHFAQYNAHSRRLKLWFLNFKLHLIQSKTDYNKHNHKTQATRTHKYIYPSVRLSYYLSVFPSLRPCEGPPFCTRLPQWRIPMKFDISLLFEKSVEKVQIFLKS